MKSVFEKPGELHEKDPRHAPAEYMRELCRTAMAHDNYLPVMRFDDDDNPYIVPFKVKITNDTEAMLAKEYTSLLHTLTKLGRCGITLLDEDERRRTLSEHELWVWDTYISPMDPMVADDKLVRNVYLYGIPSGTSKRKREEYFRRRDAWLRRESLKRLPYVRDTPRAFIEKARCYMWAVCFDGITNDNDSPIEARLLAQEMVIYHCNAETETL